MTLEQQAAELVAKWEHGDEAHRQWLRDIAIPDLIVFAKAVRNDTLYETLEALVQGADLGSEEETETWFKGVRDTHEAIRALLDFPTEE